MTDAAQPVDEQSRTITLIHGVLANGNPFWLFAAVRPAKYAAMTEAQKAGTLDLYKFETYGEIIVSGEGKNPPEAIIMKVAEIYQTDLSGLVSGE